jgi:hypothetical protein
MRSWKLLAICGLIPACTMIRESPSGQAKTAANEDIPLNPRVVEVDEVVEVVEADEGDEVVEVDELEVVEERVEIPERKTRKETASIGDGVYVTSKRSAASETPGKGRVTASTAPPRGMQRALPGTARADAAPVFVRSSVPLGAYRIQQGTDARSLEAKQSILEGLSASALPAGGAGITVITRGERAILFGKLASEHERTWVEELARANVRSVESHLEVPRLSE